MTKAPNFRVIYITHEGEGKDTGPIDIDTAEAMFMGTCSDPQVHVTMLLVKYPGATVGALDRWSLGRQQIAQPQAIVLPINPAGPSSKLQS